jgi:hypothetical protein
MVGNASWNFPDRDVGDRSRKETVVFARWPKKTNKGWCWLVDVRRVSTIEQSDDWFGSGLFKFLGLGGYVDVEVIRWETL